MAPWSLEIFSTAFGSESVRDLGEEELAFPTCRGWGEEGEGGSILQVWTDPGLAAGATFFKMLPENPLSARHPDLAPHPNYSHALLSSILGVPGFARPSIP